MKKLIALVCVVLALALFFVTPIRVMLMNAARKLGGFAKKGVIIAIDKPREYLRKRREQRQQAH